MTDLDGVAGCVAGGVVGEAVGGDARRLAGERGKIVDRVVLGETPAINACDAGHRCTCNCCVGDAAGDAGRATADADVTAADVAADIRLGSRNESEWRRGKAERSEQGSCGFLCHDAIIAAAWGIVTGRLSAQRERPPENSLRGPFAV